MKYILVRFKGQPPAARPVGALDVVAMGEYKSRTNAVRFMRPAPARSQALRGMGYTHAGLYTRPTDPTRGILVETIKL